MSSEFRKLMDIMHQAKNNLVTQVTDTITDKLMFLPKELPQVVKLLEDIDKEVPSLLRLDDFWNNLDEAISDKNRIQKEINILKEFCLNDKVYPSFEDEIFSKFKLLYQEFISTIPYLAGRQTTDGSHRNKKEEIINWKEGIKLYTNNKVTGKVPVILSNGTIYISTKNYNYHPITLLKQDPKNITTNIGTSPVLTAILEREGEKSLFSGYIYFKDADQHLYKLIDKLNKEGYILNEAFLEISGVTENNAQIIRAANEATKINFSYEQRRGDEDHRASLYTNKLGTITSTGKYHLWKNDS